MQLPLVYPLIATVTSRLGTEDLRMDSIERLSGQLLGFWLAIIGISVAFGVLYSVGRSLRRKKQHPGLVDEADRSN
jgi:hypothetical protein